MEYKGIELKESDRTANFRPSKEDVGLGHYEGITEPVETK